MTSRGRPLAPPIEPGAEFAAGLVVREVERKVMPNGAPRRRILVKSPCCGVERVVFLCNAHKSAQCKRCASAKLMQSEAWAEGRRKGQALYAKARQASIARRVAERVVRPDGTIVPGALLVGLDIGGTEPCGIYSLADFRRALGNDALDHHAELRAAVGWGYR